VYSQGGGWDPYEVLDVVDSRTLKGLLQRGGLWGDSGPVAEPLTYSAFLAGQRLISQKSVLRALAAGLEARQRRLSRRSS
jgi:hypothetical protein